MKHRALLSIACACACLSAAGALRAADFGLDFLDVPKIVRGSRGETKRVRVFAVLSCPIDAPPGVRAWSACVGVEGAGIRSIDAKSIAVTAVLEGDGTAVDPYTFDLEGHEIHNQIFWPGQPLGAVSGTALPEKVTLKPGGEQAVAEIVLDVPVGEVESALILRFSNDVPDPGYGLCSVTADGGVFTPTLASRTVRVLPDTPPGGDYRLAFAIPGSPPPDSGDTSLEIATVPGEILIPVDVYLGTSGIQGSEGPQGWSIAIAADPRLSIVEATVEGITVTVITRQGEKQVPLPLPPGGPGPFLLESPPPSGAWPCPLPDRMQGAMSAIVLDTGQPMTLRPNVMDRVLRVVFKATVEGVEPIECRAFFTDGLVTEGHEPVMNVITLNSASHRPTIAADLAIRIGTIIEEHWSVFIRGDTNDDAVVDISDAIKVLDVLFVHPGSTFVCREAADANGDENVDLTDAIFILANLFMGGQPPPYPYPDCDWIGESPTCPPGNKACW